MVIEVRAGKWFRGAGSQPVHGTAPGIGRRKTHATGDRYGVGNMEIVGQEKNHNDGQRYEDISDGVNAFLVNPGRRCFPADSIGDMSKS